MGGHEEVLLSGGLAVVLSLERKLYKSRFAKLWEAPQDSLSASSSTARISFIPKLLTIH